MNLAEARRQLSYAIGVIRHRPFQVLLQVTNRCNMTCPFCGFWENGAAPGRELSLGEFRSFEKQLSEAGCFLVSIEGGEPLLRDDLPGIVGIFARRHIPLLYTNGWHVDHEKANALFAAGLAQAGVSIDFPDPARHDAMRGRPETFERAWGAVERLRDAAPHGGKQVHVMTVLMEENRRDLEALLSMSAERGVGHSFTLLSAAGERRGGGETAPRPPFSAALMRLWARFPHLRVFRENLEGVDRFLQGNALPPCRMGRQGFNVDHIGNVSRCIETIGQPFGSIRNEPLDSILGRMATHSATTECQRCWTACRGYSQALGDRNLGSYLDLARRMRSA